MPSRFGVGMFLGQLLVWTILFALGIYCLQRENLKAHAYGALQEHNLVDLAKYLEKWRQLEPNSGEVLYLSARRYFELFLNDDEENLDTAQTLYAQAIEADDRNSLAYYHWAILQLVKMRIYTDQNSYVLFCNLMRQACRHDPQNYYYYSIFFEELMSLFADDLYLRLGLSRSDFTPHISFALSNYLRLQDWYKEHYLTLLATYFTSGEQADILAKL